MQIADSFGMLLLNLLANILHQLVIFTNLLRLLMQIADSIGMLLLNLFTNILYQLVIFTNLLRLLMQIADSFGMLLLNLLTNIVDHFTIVANLLGLLMDFADRIRLLLLNLLTHIVDQLIKCTFPLSLCLTMNFRAKIKERLSTLAPFCPVFLLLTDSFSFLQRGRKLNSVNNRLGSIS